LLRELKILYACIQFYTQIPLPAVLNYSPDHLQKSIRYLTLVGLFVGSTGAFVFYLISSFLPLTISIVITMAFLVAITGGLHEDGFADVCDGFGGGQTPQRILEIMKDSHIGVFGVLGLVFLLLTKVFCLAQIGILQTPLLLIIAHTSSRILPVLMIYTSKYVRLDGSSKAKYALPHGNLYNTIPVLIFGLLPMYLLNWKINVFIIGILLCAFIIMRWYFHKKIGGYTGDILGAMQQIGETLIFLGYIVFTYNIP